MDVATPSSDADSIKSPKTSTNNDGKECLKLRISTNHVDGTPRIVANNSSGSSPSKNNVAKEKNGVVKPSKHQDGIKKDSTTKPSDNHSHGNHHHHHHHSKEDKNHSSAVKLPSSSSSLASKPKDLKENSAKDCKPKENSTSKVDVVKIASKGATSEGSTNNSINKPKVPSTQKPVTGTIKSSSSSSPSSSALKAKDGSIAKPKDGVVVPSKPKDISSKPKEGSSTKDSSGKPKDVSSSNKHGTSSSSSAPKTTTSSSSSKPKPSGDKLNSSTSTITNNSHHSTNSKPKDSSSKEASKSSSLSSSAVKSSSDKKHSSSSSSNSGIKSPQEKSLKSADDLKAKKPVSSKPKESESQDRKDFIKVKAKEPSSKDSKEKVKDDIRKEIKKEPKSEHKTHDSLSSVKVKEEKPSTPMISKVKKEQPVVDNDTDVSLSPYKSSSSSTTTPRESRKATKRPACESESDDDEPLTRSKHSKQIKKETSKKSSSSNKKRKIKDDYSSEEEPISKKSKRDDRNKPPPSSPNKRKKKEEEEQEVWKWWEEEKLDDGIKWKKLEHKGPVFAPVYERLPDSVKFYYNGEVLKLSDEAEEVATFYSKLLEHDYTTKEAFNHNFFKDWRKVMTSKERELITDLKKCDFRKMNAYFLQKTEERKAMTKEEKSVLKAQNEDITKEYGFCTIDGHKEKIGNFKIEPPGLFRGRGEHPKMGRHKKRILPENVIINCSKDSKIPAAPKGHKWKEVRHDNTVTWLACWQENVQGQTKYVMLNPSSKLKGEKDWQKYEVARRLKGCVDKIRRQYQQDFRSKEMKVRQRAVALYFIDQLALRAGNEKEEGETADTVGCCSLRVEHITLDDEKDGKQHVVSFDFLGKDSIRYENSVSVEKRVFKNLHIFMESKQPGDDLFDRLNTAVLNKHLNELMEGLTAKVFRTYNASKTLQEQLNLLTEESDPVMAKMLSYNRANRAVAILCNHQRAVPKTFDKSMGNLQTKIQAKKDVVKDAEKEYKAAKKEKNKTLMEKKKKAVDRLKEQLEKLELQATDKEENKQIALGTSKLNYLDPRITVAWCKKHEVPIEKVYNRTQRDKFRWAVEMAGPDFVF